MPIFGRPYDPAGYQFTNTGFDFARGYTVNAKTELGDASGGTAATIVDWRGKDMSPPKWTYDNHDAWDINMDQGTKIYAAADGTVQMARFRDITNACPGGYTVPNQGEVYIRHTVSGGTNTSLYDEYFVTYYAHFVYPFIINTNFAPAGPELGERLPDRDRPARLLSGGGLRSMGVARLSMGRAVALPVGRGRCPAQRQLVIVLRPPGAGRRRHPWLAE
jgi:hypothetical protein